MWFIGVEVEQETSAPPPKKNPGSAPDTGPGPPIVQRSDFAIHRINRYPVLWFPIIALTSGTRFI